MTSHTAPQSPLGPDGDTVALEKAAELEDYAAADVSSSTGSSRKVGADDDGRSHGVLHVATAVGLPLSAYIVAASLYFATTIPYSSDFFCDG